MAADDGMGSGATSPLSAREREVVGLYLRGQSYKQVARGLGISPGTTRTHLNNIYRKLNVQNRFDLMRLMSENGLHQADKYNPLNIGEVAYPIVTITLITSSRPLGHHNDYIEQSGYPFHSPNSARLAEMPGLMMEW